MLKDNCQLAQMFSRLRTEGGKAIIPFLTAGYPDIPSFYRILRELADVSDAIEIGIPFSDPLADGKTIQHASEVALRQGMTLHRLMRELEERLPEIPVPVLIMTYFNPILQYPLGSFLDRCRELGIAGLIVPDLPFEERSSFSDSCTHEALPIPLIRFITPATKEERLREIVSSAEGFLYVVSITGITGSRTALPEETQGYLKKVRSMTDKPLCLGFGISSPSQVRRYRELADGFIVGSALIDCIDSGKDPAAFISLFSKESVTSRKDV